MSTNLELSDRYQVEKTLGAGAVGVAYLCFDKTLDTRVTIKVLKDSARDKDIARFHKEAKLAAKLNHPNVVQVYDFGQSKDGQVYLVMQFCPGENLKELLERKGTLEEKEALYILRDIASGLAHAHDKEILHRDIKPANIILSRDEDDNIVARLADFGLAKMMMEESNQALTSTGSIIGTPAYMSPEAAGNREVLCASDIFSCGCVAFEMLTGSLPHKENNSLATISSLASKQAPSISDVSDREFHPSLTKLVEKCLSLDPKNRYADGKELHQAINEVLRTLNSQPAIQLKFDESDKKADNKFLWKLVGSLIVTSIVCTLIASQVLAIFDRSEPERILTNKPLKMKEHYELYSDGSSAIDVHDVRKKKLGDIEWHDLYGMNTAEHLQLVKGRKDIRYLTMASDDMRGTGFDIIQTLNLEGLRLTDCTISDRNMSSIGKLRNLKVLQLFSCQGYKEESLLEALSIKSLLDLNVGDTIIGDRVIDKLVEMKGLTRLSLEKCDNFTGKSLEKLSALKNLKRLDLAKSGFKKENLKKLKSLRNLEALDISGLQLRSKDIVPICQMNLVELNIDENFLDDKGLNQLSKLKSLKKLCIENNPSLSIKAITRFSTIRKDCALIKKELRDWDYRSKIPFAE